MEQFLFWDCSFLIFSNMKTTLKTKGSKPKRHSQRIELKRLKAENPNICTLIEKLDLVLIKNPKQ
jgi:hypothetical protein